MAGIYRDGTELLGGGLHSLSVFLVLLYISQMQTKSNNNLVTETNPFWEINPSVYSNDYNE